MDDLKRIRKLLPWMLLNCGIVLFLCYLTSFGGFFEQLANLQALAPVVRVKTLSIMVLFLTAFAVLIPIILTMKVIPLGVKIVKKTVFIFNAVAFLGFGLMVLLILISTPLQNHYMPKLGYSKCTELQGNPTLWFTDWVKNPDWCVRGKSIEWVNKQARQSSTQQHIYRPKSKRNRTLHPYRVDELAVPYLQSILR